jgi:hypothetical protein
VALDYIDVMFYGLRDERDWKVCFIIIWNLKILVFTAV